jgi:uncharacterized protein YcgL (UPF0745 family)
MQNNGEISRAVNKIKKELKSQGFHLNTTIEITLNQVISLMNMSLKEYQ